jgi:hypothetical protein
MALRRPEEVDAYCETLTGKTGIAPPGRLKYWRKVDRGPRHVWIEGRIYYDESDVSDWLLRQVGPKGGAPR